MSDHLPCCPFGPKSPCGPGKPFGPCSPGKPISPFIKILGPGGPGGPSLPRTLDIIMKEMYYVHVHHAVVSQQHSQFKLVFIHIPLAPGNPLSPISPLKPMNPVSPFNPEKNMLQENHIYFNY